MRARRHLAHGVLGIQWMLLTQTGPPPGDRYEEKLRSRDRISAYRIEHLLGTGGMRSVYRAEHAFLPREVALKVLRADQLGQDCSVDRMMREAAALATIGHRGVPRLFECGLLEDRRPWIAMELVAGLSLAARLEHGPLPPSDAIALVGEIAAVLAAAQDRGFTHRDLKPDNIFLVSGDPAFPVRLIDWGIAHQVTGARLTSMNEALGTPTYMAPEQARGGPVGGHCDVYGLGVVAYQALTGYPPFYMAPEQVANTRDVDARADVYSLGVMLYEALVGEVPYAEDSVIDMTSVSQ